MLKRMLIFTISTMLLTGCGGVDSSITDLVDSSLNLLPTAQNRVDPDFIPGEIVTTSNGTPGYQVKAVFGEVSEKQTTTMGTPGWQVDGVFYE